MFPSFTGSARRPRQVNLSGRNSNPFAVASSSRQSPSTQSSQNTVAHAQAERALRQQERQRPPAATAIQRSWRGYRSRRDIRNSWRRQWDAIEEEAMRSDGRKDVQGSDPAPYKSEQDCLEQMKMLVHFATPREKADWNRLNHFARRYGSGRQKPMPGSLPEVWISPLLRLGKLTITMLNSRTPTTSPAEVNVLLRLLRTIAITIPYQLTSCSQQYFEALGSIAREYGKGVGEQQYDWANLYDSLVALLEPASTRSITAYAGFASQFLCVMDLPLDILDGLIKEIRLEDLAFALSDLLGSKSPGTSENLLHSRTPEELLWLLAYFIFFFRHANHQGGKFSEALYVTILSKLTSHLAVDIASRVDSTSFISPAPVSLSASSASRPLPPLPSFVRDQIFSLVSQDHVSGLLAQSAVSASSIDDASMSFSKPVSTLAVYALTLLRAFPRRGDDIRTWLHLGSTRNKSAGLGVTVPAIKYYYHAASQTAVFRFIKSDPRNAIGLLNPTAKRKFNTPSISDREEQWQIILLFLELYPIVLRVMDDEEFLNGAASFDMDESLTRRSALTLVQVKDLTLFLKNLTFCMYWYASDIAGVEEPENKNSIAEYFSGIQASFSDDHPDARSSKPHDSTIAGLPGMTVSYMKGMVTGLLRMIYERE
ncbi:MAG: hypothetical protein Q9220_004712 [cf. Caloplaca sp. 1 TL-2023]